jgi:hypothetical protein
VVGDSIQTLNSSSHEIKTKTQFPLLINELSKIFIFFNNYIPKINMFALDSQIIS